MSSLKLENGYVVDGSGQPMFKGNVVVGGDRIIDVSGSDLGVAEETVNISGLILSPGFIDMHSHSDLSLLKNPHAESMIRQGVTTEVIGNCGISVAPVEDETKSQLLGYASPLLGVEDIPVAWRGFGEYLSYMEKAGSALNVTPLVGHGTIRIAVMGFDDVEGGLLIEPQLSTMHVPKEEMGALAVKKMINIIENPTTNVDKTLISVELMVRESCGGKGT